MRRALPAYAPARIVSPPHSCLSMRRLLSATLALGLFAIAAPASAQQLVYQPTNPAFGGSSLNYSWLLQSAQLQNQHEDEGSASANSTIDNFADTLQRQILNQLSRELITNRFGDLDLTQPGTFSLGDFQIDITPGLDGVSIRLFNLLTGEETIVSIPNSL